MTFSAYVKAVPKTVRSALGQAHRGLVFLWCLPVRLYRRYLSPLKGHGSCRFTPTCSRYFLDAVAEWGIAAGTLLALVRLVRCNPFSEGGSDPVPKRRDAAARIKAFFRGTRRAGNPETRNPETPEGGASPRSPQFPTEK